MWSEEDICRLKSGEAPENGELLRRISAGAEFITDFWLEQYIDEYIALGGSKIKFLTGSPGSGKTHLLRLFLHEAGEHNCKAVYLSAKNTWIHDFKEIFTAVLERAELEDCFEKCAELIIRELGYDPADIPQGMSFADCLAQNGELTPITRREIRAQLNALFYKNTRIDKNFAVCAALLTGAVLGHPVLEPSSEYLLYDWLMGVKGLRAAELRKLGLSGTRITKQNARHMLRSLIEVIKLAGYSGLVIGIDNLETLCTGSPTDEIRYTKMRREDSYESIRELIDEIDTLNNAMFVFSFRPELLENESAGIKSYQALWMRIQNEIESDKFNRFADIIDLDKLAKQRYTPETFEEMSRLVCAELGNASAVSAEAAAVLMSDSNSSDNALPRRIISLTLADV